MLIRSGDVTLRSFETALSDAVLQIRNHPSVRLQLRNTAPIKKMNIINWL